MRRLSIPASVRGADMMLMKNMALKRRAIYMTNWVDVREWLPEDCIDVLLKIRCLPGLDSSYLIVVAHYYSYNEKWFINTGYDDTGFFSVQLKNAKPIAWTLLPKF
jgi:hypothetical protein